MSIRNAVRFALAAALVGSAIASAGTPAPEGPAKASTATAAPTAGTSAPVAAPAAAQPAAAPAAAPAAPAVTAFSKSVAPAELQALRQSRSAPVVLDVRSPEEFAAGHVPGAINVQHDQVESRLAELERFRDRDIVLYCRSGRRAGAAAEVLRRHGFGRLVHLDGDMPGWESAGLPVEKP